jgi:hypothetical protein
VSSCIEDFVTVKVYEKLMSRLPTPEPIWDSENNFFPWETMSTSLRSRHKGRDKDTLLKYLPATSKKESPRPELLALATRFFEVVQNS